MVEYLMLFRYVCIRKMFDVKCGWVYVCEGMVECLVLLISGISWLPLTPLWMLSFLSYSVFFFKASDIVTNQDLQNSFDSGVNMISNINSFVLSIVPKDFLIFKSSGSTSFMFLICFWPHSTVVENKIISSNRSIQ